MNVEEIEKNLIQADTVPTYGQGPYKSLWSQFKENLYFFYSSS
jgi:hypothetical protein